MIDLIAVSLRWITRHFMSFAVILAILVGGQWFYKQVHEAKAAYERTSQIQSSRPALLEGLLSAARQIEQQIQQATRVGHAGGKVKQALDQLLAQKNAERTAIKSRSPFDGLPTVSDFKRLAVLEMEIAALQKASDDARQLEWFVSDISQGREQWATLWQQHQKLLNDWEEKHQEIAGIRLNHPVKHGFPLTTPYERIQRLIDEQRELGKQADQLNLRIQTLIPAVKLSQQRFDSLSKTVGIGGADVDAALGRFDTTLATEIHRRSSSFFWGAAKDFWPAVQAQMFNAALIILAVILVPIGIKLLFFYVIGPWAARQPAIQILPSANPSSPVQGIVGVGNASSDSASAVSVSVEIKPDEELLVHSDYIQSSSITSTKTTKWVLDSSFPFTSLAAGLYALTRVAPQQTETIVISSSRDYLMEVTVVAVPADSAIVVQPRALAGVLHARLNPIKITSHWRIGHLHSWLTLQFRYIAFHGPAKLIVRGCRGVRVESAGDGRIINQAATIGFSADACYSVRRCETFVAYWRGVEELFNDQFSGANCVYLYEEMPSLHRNAGVTGRGLEGLTDSALKVLGV